MKVWDYPAYVKRMVSNKLEVKFNKCLFVGYPKEMIGYQFYNTLEQKFFVSKHDVFLEKEFLLREDSRRKVELGEVQDALIGTSHLTEPEAIVHDDELTTGSSNAQALRRTNRIRTVSKRYGFLINELNDVFLI